MSADDAERQRRSSERLFHFAPLELPARWAADPRPWEPPSLASEGFVHLSFADQLAGTLQAHFQGVRATLLLELERAAVQERLVLEASRGGALFPHLYRALRCEDVLGAWVLRAEPDWELPRFGASAAQDEPGSQPWTALAGES